MATAAARRGAGARPLRRAGRARRPGPRRPRRRGRAGRAARRRTRCAASPTGSTRGAPGKRSVVVDGPDDPALDALLAGADIVIDTPGAPGRARRSIPARAPDAVWVSITPFGRDRARAALARVRPRRDGGERQHVLHRRPRPRAGPLHASRRATRTPGGEAAFAALTALVDRASRTASTSRCRRSSFVANMAAPGARSRSTGFRGRRLGAHIGRTREIWPTKDGFVSLRAARRQGPGAEPRDDLASRRRDGIDGADALTERDWTTYSPEHRDRRGPARDRAADRASTSPRHTMQELYDLACETNLMLAPANSPREILASAQLAARDFFGPVGDVEQFPRSVRRRAQRRRRGRAGAAARHPRTDARRPARTLLVERPPASRSGPGVGPPGVGRRQHPRVRLGRGRADRDARTSSSTARRCCGSSRRAAPTSCACTRSGPKNPHGLEGAPMYDGLNVGKRNVTLQPEAPRRRRARAPARRRVGRRGRRELRARARCAASASTTTRSPRSSPTSS